MTFSFLNERGEGVFCLKFEQAMNFQARGMWFLQVLEQTIINVLIPWGTLNWSEPIVSDLNTWYSATTLHKNMQNMFAFLELSLAGALQEKHLKRVKKTILITGHGNLMTGVSHTVFTFKENIIQHFGLTPELHVIFFYATR